MSCERQKKDRDKAKKEYDWQNTLCEAIYNEPNQGPLSDDYTDCQQELSNLKQKLDEAEDALRQCERETETRLMQTEGLVTFLRVHELKTGFGGGRTNFLNAEVVFKLDSHPEKAFGFQLRDNKFLPTRQGMLDILRDAIVHDLKVITDYEELVLPPNENCIVIRVAISKFRPQGRPGGEIRDPSQLVAGGN